MGGSRERSSVMRKAGRWSRRHLAVALFGTAGILVGIAVAIGLGLNASEPQPLPFELAKSLFAAATGLILGGLLKLATEDHTETKRQQDEIEKRVDALIADMHASHDRLETTRLLIAANRSAKVYGDRMHDVIDAHVVLSRIARTPGIAFLLRDRDDACCLESMMG